MCPSAPDPLMHPSGARNKVTEANIRDFNGCCRLQKKEVTLRNRYLLRYTADRSTIELQRIAGVAEGGVMPAVTPELLQSDAAHEELQILLKSELFSRSPSLAHLLSYLCEKAFSGESNQIKEYSVAVEVFGRPESFDQDADSIVRVQANRLRKRLAEYYATEGASHRIHITIPVGQYVPIFEEHTEPPPETVTQAPPVSVTEPSPHSHERRLLPSAELLLSRIWPSVVVVLLAILGVIVLRQPQNRPAIPAPPQPSTATVPLVGLPVGDEIRILAGSSRSYVDRSGKSWSADQYFTAGTSVRSPVQHIWRTLDPTVYRSSRQGDFKYDIPLKPGVYELHLHFAETFYGPEDPGGGGEGSRVMSVAANGKPLLSDFDVIADADGGRTADVKVFTDLAPAQDGLLHLAFSSVKGGRAMLSAIEILPGSRGHIRPVRIVARDTPYYSNDSQWWSSDIYFKGGQLASSEEPAESTDDPEFYETERWGNFSYAIPLTPGKYVVSLYFIERDSRKLIEDSSSASEQRDLRVFSVYCNGKAIVSNLNILQEVGPNRPLVRHIAGVEPNAQGKILLDFVPLSQYATVSAVEVLPQ